MKQSITKWSIAVMALWTTTAGAQSIDPHSILNQAQKSLMERQNISARFEGSHALVESIVPGEVGRVNRYVTGNFLKSGGRHRCQIDGYYTDGDGEIIEKAWERRKVYSDGKSKFMRTGAPEGITQHDAIIDSKSTGYFMATGTWMLTSSIDVFSQADMEYELKSVFQNMLEQSIPDSLQAYEEQYQDRTLVRVESSLPFGLCTVWLDPERDHNMVKFHVDLAIYNELTPRMTVESGMIELTRIDDKWVPASASYTKTYFADDDPRYGSGEFVYQADMHLHDIEFVSDSEPDDLFHLEFPPGTSVRDYSLDIRYLASDPGRHQIELLVSELIRKGKGKDARLESEPSPDAEPAVLADDELASVQGENGVLAKSRPEVREQAPPYGIYALAGGLLVVVLFLTYSRLRPGPRSA